MRKDRLIRKLPLLPYAGTLALFSTCGCGHCPACLGASASVVGLALYIGTKRLLSLKGRGGESLGEGEKAQGGS
ncbi:MAG: hypothetical protein N2648_04330 [Aquificaceae bacterium]|nr:hypothetical protein [Aquificaceae bacterium]MCX7989851.1 hypothetical protein [Aquificaceae bacterium]MDW8033233.1 hypothetical protein [Aquificaceae bacterium]MDW8295177.1 hypothetical protein [Aquificaceae bacterium]